MSILGRDAALLRLYTDSLQVEIKGSSGLSVRSMGLILCATNWMTERRKAELLPAAKRGRLQAVFVAPACYFELGLIELYRR